MKGIIIFIIVVTVFILETESTSSGRCFSECDPSKCHPLECACGSYRDRCACCSSCYKCSGDSCSFIERDRCSEGHECKRSEEATETGPDFNNLPGTCVEIEETEETSYD